ncbi:MAG: MbnP family protein [Bacteroidales bacterium]|jgi:hypothetical protein
MKKPCAFLLFLFPVVFISCHKKEAATNSTSTGNVTLAFAHYVNGSPVQLDTMIYTNAAGNLYEVDDFKYFISDVQFHKSDGSVTSIGNCTWCYYVDNTIPSTLTWNICDKLPLGTYDSISFRFGIISSKNLSNMFVNPPESAMAWPPMLGGGYHYMQLDGKWKDSVNNIDNFGTHLGIGRVIYGSDTIFVDNSFHVKLPSSEFTLLAGATPVIQIIMNIEKWYSNPYVFDFNYYGGYIMMNQDAMHKISANGWDVFTIGYIH